MDFIGTKKKTGDSRKTHNLAFVRVAQDPRTKIMTMAEIEQKAVSLGVQPSQMNKTELIHSIQRAEGNTACFKTANGRCLYTDCCFMADCLKV